MERRAAESADSADSADSAERMDLIGSESWALAANALTIIRFVGAPLLAVMVAFRNPWWLSFWFGWFLGATDFLDGRFARRAKPTRLGAFLDPLADKLVILLVGYVLVSIGRFGWLPVTIIAVREVGLTVYRSYWARRGLAIPSRKLAKYKTFVQGLAVAAAMFPPLENNHWIADGLLWLAVGITLVTAFQYAIDGQASLRSGGER